MADQLWLMTHTRRRSEPSGFPLTGLCLCCYQSGELLADLYKFLLPCLKLLSSKLHVTMAVMVTVRVGYGGRDDYDRGYAGRGYDRDYDDRDRYGGRRGWDDGTPANFISRLCETAAL